MYWTVKHLHQTTVAISLGLFLLRGIWMLMESPRLHAPWVRVLPHLNDTILLASALYLAHLLGQYPFVNAWLTAKALALLVYIGLGTVALKRGRSKRIKAGAFAAAILTFGYIVAVALTQDPWPLDARLTTLDRDPLFTTEG
jgi:uncharacterized membrane protein SirB2